MKPTGFLPAMDLLLLTRRRKHKAQCRMLERMGIRFTRHPDGSPIVEWADVNNRGMQPAPQQKHTPEPKFEALLRGKKTTKPH